MGRPRTKNLHFPKYYKEIHGSIWYCPPKKKPERVCYAGEDHLMYAHAAKSSEPAGPITFMNDLFDRYAREVVPTFKPRTQKDYAKTLKVLRKTFGHMRPDEIRPRDVGEFLDRPKGKIHANKQVAVLSAVFSKAVGKWYCADRNPCTGVERNESKHRNRYVNDQEYWAFYAIVPERMKIAMELARLTGQRQGDLLTLRWDNVTEDGVLFQQGKTGKRLMVEMSMSLGAVLGRAKTLLPHLPREYVLRTAPKKGDKDRSWKDRRGGQPYTSDGFRAIWQRYMRKAIKLGVIKERFTFHDLRAKSVSDAGTLQEAFDRAGHTSMAMTRGVYDRGIRKVKPLK
jgi:integrase